jgi:shikimate kinase
MSPVVVLVGLPGAGNRSTGRRLAKILAVPFADSDELVEAAAGRSVAAIFAESGEPAFRTAEAAAVAAALGDFAGVLALGGGAVASPATRAALARAEVPVAVLRARLATLCTRVGDARTRPVLGAHPEARLAELAAQREPLYAEIATFGVDTDERSPGQVAAVIAARLHARGALV